MMRTIILQDAAAMIALDPSRKNHGLFSLIHVFQTAAFETYCAEMKDFLDEADTNNPVNTSIDLALPGVISRLTSMDSQLLNTYQVLDRLDREYRQTNETLIEDVTTAVETAVEKGIK